ncbi:MAG: hypothetical protein M3Q98_09205 [Actinomycetota bacterium]|nr:hypothetical protein [Actinomycetota bacterium]
MDEILRLHEPLDLDRHGTALYDLAFMLTDDRPRAERIVSQAIASRRAGILHREKGDSRSAARGFAAIIYLSWFCVDSSSPPAPGSPTSGFPTAAILRALRVLPEDHRAAVALCVFGGHTCREAAAVLGLPPRHVAALLRDAVRDLDVAGYASSS